jgi:hypothetical protein
LHTYMVTNAHMHASVQNALWMMVQRHIRCMNTGMHVMVIVVQRQSINACM